MPKTKGIRVPKGRCQQVGGLPEDWHSKGQRPPLSQGRKKTSGKRPTNAGGKSQERPLLPG